jgi:mono/diheme cytochrome c family protein
MSKKSTFFDILILRYVGGRSKPILGGITTLAGVGMLRKSALVVLFGLFGNFAAVAAEPAPDASRGELLYSTHCIACHTAQVHWRDKKLATNWESLKSQVRRWQNVLEQKWGEQDISEVARYLNTLHYHYPVTD